MVGRNFGPIFGPIFGHSFGPHSTQFVSASVTAVAEPETHTLMLAGLAAAGFIARRRR